MSNEGDKIRVEAALKISVKERTEIQHLWLVKHYGGVREYLLSMGDFKEDNPTHFCDCGKYLGFRGFCSKECHDKHYDASSEQTAVKKE